MTTRAAVLATLLACTPSAPAAERTPSPAPSPTSSTRSSPSPVPSPFRGRWEELSLTRGTCEIACPAFTVVVRPSGEVLWHGYAEVEQPGVHLGQIDAARVDRVVEQLVAAGISEAEPEYDAQRTHGVTTVMSLALDGVTLSVRERGDAAPPALREALEELDELVPAIAWSSSPAADLPIAGPHECTAVTRSVRAICEPFFAGTGSRRDCAEALRLGGLAAALAREAPELARTRGCDLIAGSPVLRAEPSTASAPLRVPLAPCRQFVKRVRDDCLGGSTMLDCHVAMQMVESILRDARDRRDGKDVMSSATQSRMCQNWLERL